VSAQSSKVNLALAAAARASAHASLALAEALEEAAREEDVTAVVVPSAPSSRSRVRRARPIERPAGESDDLTAARARKILKGHGFIARGR
jgi:predicted flap endonuclease-1-like 5' DNA nuclease